VTPERWKQIEAVFDNALDLPTGERSAFLERTCEGDEELRREVVSLLSSHQQAGSFIEHQSLFLPEEEPDGRQAALTPGQVVGRYRIDGEIGRGGMGSVYLAARADEQYEKQVALKLIKRGMDTDYVIRRFRNERQILASFEHANIARLIDGDTIDDGLPYFVMEYVEGVPIDEYCDAHALTITERLELFRQVCAAVSYAHRHLVIHRDIKPSNILVTDEGVPKLLDFGIAKILQPSGSAETIATATGLRLMTPEYASPEQVQGHHVTTVTDVYSLGVVLYELLTGRSPYRFKSRSPQDIARTVSETEPVKPSTIIDTIEEVAAGDITTPEARTPESVSKSREGSPDRLRRRLRGDLDNIVLMAMRKEPGRRYQSVEQFSEDIRRHLEGLPVLARKDTLSYRSAKFVRRNKVAVAAAAIVFLTLLGGIVASTWQAHRASVQETIAKAEKARAERRFNDLRKLANSVLFDYHDAIKDLPGATPVRERLVRDALAYLDSLAGEAGNDPELERELAAAYERVGDVRGQAYSASLGDSAGAMESYLKALRIREDLVTAAPLNMQNRRDLADSHRKVGNLLLDTSEAPRGLEHLQQALALYLDLAAKQPVNFDVRPDLAAIYNDIGLALEDRGDAPGALENHRKSLLLREELLAAEPGNQRHRRNLSVTYVNTGRALYLSGDLAGALEINRKALALRAVLVAEDPTNADYRRLLAISYQNDGDFREEFGDTRGALESFRKKIALDSASLAADPANAQSHGDFGYSSQRLGDLLTALGDHTQALSHFRQALDAFEALAASNPQNLSLRYSIIIALAGIAKTQGTLGNRSAAVDASRKSIALLADTVDDPNNAGLRSSRAAAYIYLADAYAALASSRVRPSGEAGEHWRAARDMYQRSLDIWQDMRDRGVLNRKDALRFEAVAHREMARCDAVLRK
jgi:serine/threonine protein kinase/tetratricopeptide (TPR) repeat protein